MSTAKADSARRYWDSLTPEEREQRSKLNRGPHQRSELNSAPQQPPGRPRLTDAQKAKNELARNRAEVEQRIRDITAKRPVTEHTLALIGLKIRRHRPLIMSQLELADSVGLGERDIDTLERGRAWFLTPAILAALCVELDLSPEVVLE